MRTDFGDGTTEGWFDKKLQKNEDKKAEVDEHEMVLKSKATWKEIAFVLITNKLRMGKFSLLLSPVSSSPICWASLT